jgi:hypothetical protein
LSADTGWFLAAGLIATDDVPALRDHIDDTLDRLQPRTDDLLDALAVPLPIVRASVADEDYVDRLAPAWYAPAAPNHLASATSSVC